MCESSLIARTISITFEISTDYGLVEDSSFKKEHFDSGLFTALQFLYYFAFEYFAMIGFLIALLISHYKNYKNKQFML